MSDQDPQAPVEDTPDPAAEVTQQPGESAVDYQQRYQEAQAWGTRASQEAAEYRRQLEGLRNGDPEAFRALGLEFADQEDTEPDEDASSLERRLAAMEQTLTEQRAQAEQTQLLQRIESHVEQSLSRIEDLDETDRNLVVQLAVAMDPLENGMPDVQGAYDSLVQRDTQAKQRWASTKKAPRVSPVGQAGTQQPDLTDAAQRQAFMAQRLAERNS